MPTHPSADPPAASSEHSAPTADPSFRPAPPAPGDPGRPAPGGAARPADGGGDPAGDVVRWAAFSCLLVPVVLVVYGASVGGAAAAALGLAAVTAACRVLLRHSERNAARALAEQAAGPRPRAAPETRARGRHGGGFPPGE